MHHGEWNFILKETAGTGESAGSCQNQATRGMPPTGSTQTGINRGAVYTVRSLFETVFFEFELFFVLLTGFVGVAGFVIRLCSNTITEAWY